MMLTRAANRRAFIAALGSAAAWPLVAHGQQGKLIRLGYLDGGRALIRLP